MSGIESFGIEPSEDAQPRVPDPLRGALLLVAGMLAWQLAVERVPVQWTACLAPRATRADEAASTAVVCNAEPGGVAPLRGPGRLLFGLPLDLNSETASSLERLPGIGPARARAIVAARCVRPIRELAELGEIRGIGPATLRGLRGLAVADGGPRDHGGPGCEQGSTLGPGIGGEP